MRNTNYYDMATGTKTTRVKILNRVRDCSCGCRGKDSWHAGLITRVVRKVEDVSPRMEATKAYVCERVTTRVGVARFPWGLSRVVYQGWQWRVAKCEHAACPAEGCCEGL